MNAIRQYHKLDESREIKISIPKDFAATEVEVIVLPSRTAYEIPDEVKKMVITKRRTRLIKSSVGKR